MKRQYRVSELLDYIKEGGLNRIQYNCLIGSDALLAAVINWVPTIKDTDGHPVDSALYSFVPHILDAYDFYTYGYFLDTRYVNEKGSMLTIRSYESIEDALEGVQEIACACMLGKIDDLTRLYYSLQLSYNPLYNKDATETITQIGTIADAHTGDDDRSIKGKTQDLTTNASTGARDGQGLDSAVVTEDASKVPYNNVNHYDTDRVKTETPVMGSDSNATNNVDYHDKTEYNSDLTKTFDKTDTHRSYGNLGVTKSTDLLEAEYQLRMQRGFWDYVYRLCLDKQFMRGVVLCE